MLHQYGNNSTMSLAHPCTCGFLYGTCGGSCGSLSILFPLSGKPYSEGNVSDNYMNTSYTPSTVDCTLSLGTPSTRHAEKTCSKQSALCVSSLSLDNINVSESTSNKQHKNAVSREVSGSCGNTVTLLARRCANCDTTSTPLWRNGPRGPKSLCNACGIRYKKEERRAAAAVAIQPVECGTGYGYPQSQQQMLPQWNERDINPYMSWRLNGMPSQPFPVLDRTGLFQYN